MSYPRGRVFAMHETPEKVEALQQLLDRSVGRAGPQLTNIIAHKARQMKANPAVSATYVDGERAAVFTHGHIDYIDSEHPLFDECDAHFVSHYKSSPKDWTPNPVFFNLRPKWMVGYAFNAREFPSEPSR
jgi:hypothetical protein